MPQDGNLDLQVARFDHEGNLTEGDYIGHSIELGGRGRLVQMWGIHHYLGTPSAEEGFGQFISALSSNPQNAGEHPDFGIGQLFADKSLYGTLMRNYRTAIAGVSGGFALWTETWVVPLYGIIRPRRQIWVLWFGQNIVGSDKAGIEIYYSEIPMPRQDVISANRKYGKFRRIIPKTI